MYSIRLASAGWVLAASPSRVPFYVAGGLLAGWAVVLALAGITHHEFPGSLVRARLVMLTSFALMAATIAMAIVTAEEPEREAAAPAATLSLAADPAGEPAYDRTRATVRAGRIEIRLDNRSSQPHNVTVVRGSEVVAATETITGGEARTTTDLRPGEYVYFCSVDAHRQAGMEGALTVR